MGKLIGVVHAKIYWNRGGGAKIFIRRVKEAVSEIVCLFLVLMAPVIIKKGSC